MAPRRMRHDPGRFFRGGKGFGQVADGKIVVLVGPHAVPLPEELGDLFFGQLHGIRSGGLDADGAHHPGELLPEEKSLARRQGNVNDIILVLAPGGLALVGQNAHHGEGELLDADHLTDRVHFAEEILHHGLPQQADLGRSIHVGLGQGSSAHHRPIPDEQGLGGGGKGDGGPVLVSDRPPG